MEGKNENQLEKNETLSLEELENISGGYNITQEDIKFAIDLYENIKEHNFDECGNQIKEKVKSMIKIK